MLAQSVMKEIPGTALLERRDLMSNERRLIAARKGSRDVIDATETQAPGSA